MVECQHHAGYPMPMSESGQEDLDRIFAALADPTRRAILRALLDGPRSVGDLAAPFPMLLAAVSKHIALLAEAGLVARSRAGRTILCRLEPDALGAPALWMQGFGSFDASDYDALERLVETVLGSGGGLYEPLGRGEVD